MPVPGRGQVTDISKNIVPINLTKHICKACRGRIWWVFVPIEAHWQIIEGERVWVPYDWYLDVHCFCGDVTEMDIVEECYNTHRQMACAKIHQLQNDRLEQLLGLDLAEHIHTINGGSF